MFSKTIISRVPITFITLTKRGANVDERFVEKFWKNLFQTVAYLFMKQNYNLNIKTVFSDLLCYGRGNFFSPVWI